MVYNFAPTRIKNTSNRKTPRVYTQTHSRSCTNIFVSFFSIPFRTTQHSMLCSSRFTVAVVVVALMTITAAETPPTDDPLKREAEAYCGARPVIYTTRFDSLYYVLNHTTAAATRGPSAILHLEPPPSVASSSSSSTKQSNTNTTTTCECSGLEISFDVSDEGTYGLTPLQYVTQPGTTLRAYRYWRNLPCSLNGLTGDMTCTPPTRALANTTVLWAVLVNVLDNPFIGAPKYTCLMSGRPAPLARLDITSDGTARVVSLLPGVYETSPVAPVDTPATTSHAPIYIITEPDTAAAHSSKGWIAVLAVVLTMLALALLYMCRVWRKLQRATSGANPPTFEGELTWRMKLALSSGVYRIRRAINHARQFVWYFCRCGRGPVMISVEPSNMGSGEILRIPVTDIELTDAEDRLLAVPPHDTGSSSRRRSTLTEEDERVLQLSSPFMRASSSSSSTASSFPRD